MNVKCLRAALLPTAFLLFPVWAASGQSTPSPTVEMLHGPCTSESVPNGVRLHCGNATMQLTSLSGDILRVRVGRGDTLPEDASWAVLPAARQALTHVNVETEPGRAGFSAKGFRVRVDLASLNLTVTDPAGNVLQSDAPGWLIEFHGNTFRLYKSISPDEHFFGLGDKSGGLDTDAYAYQESSDEFYKTIPFFMSFCGGRASGVLFDKTFRSSFDFGQQTGHRR
jgi:alpha-glucosidase